MNKSAWRCVQTTRAPRSNDLLFDFADVVDCVCTAIDLRVDHFTAPVLDVPCGLDYLFHTRLGLCFDLRVFAIILLGN
jgi:hypothetical protein